MSVGEGHNIQRTNGGLYALPFICVVLDDVNEWSQWPMLTVKVWMWEGSTVTDTAHLTVQGGRYICISCIHAIQQNTLEKEKR